MSNLETVFKLTFNNAYDKKHKKIKYDSKVFYNKFQLRDFAIDDINFGNFFQYNVIMINIDSDNIPAECWIMNLEEFLILGNLIS